MPTYDYKCLKCGKTFEIFQSMKDEPLKTCPKEVCEQKPRGRGRVQRQLGTGAGLIFKGSGFYITDYRSKGYHEAAKKDASTTAPKPAADSPKPSAPEKKTKPAKE
jgi:putative FmdB family regulatory protein